MAGVGGFLKADTAGLPNWAWLLVVAAGIAAATILPKYFGKATGSTTTDQTSTDTGTSQAGLGLAVDPTTGLPYAVEGLVPSGGTAGGTNIDLGSTNNLLSQLLSQGQTENTLLSNLNQPPPPAPGALPGGGNLPPPKPVPSVIDQIRSRFSSEAVKGYDTSHPQGIPIRSSAGVSNGNTIGYAAYGSTIDLTGAQLVSGSGNILGKEGEDSSNQWYKLANGTYISKFDVNALQPQQGKGEGGIYTGTQPNRGKMWPYASRSA